MRPQQPIPVTVVTGFLGAGKTTLINQLVTSEGARGRRLGLIVNDFGAINLDASEMDADGSTVLALEGGCVCCSLSAGLMSAIMALAGSSKPPEHILIEASGVSDPLGIVMPLVGASVQPLVRLAAVVAVVDVGQVDQWPSEEAAALAEAQVRGASVVVLSKTAQHGAPALWAAEDWITALSPGARLLDSADLVPTLLLDTNDDVLTGLLDPAARDRPVAQHLDAFDTWVFESDTPFVSLNGLRRTIAALPTDVIRAKGIVAVADSPKPVRFHLVGRSLATRFVEAWPDDWEGSVRSRLAVLGVAGTLSPAQLDARFNAAVAALV
ncbi:MAG: GTP-binding protein [Bacteroidota bacterium]